MIPKIMHFYWEGLALPWMRYMSLFSFRVWNPEWKIILHIGQNDCDRNCGFVFDKSVDYFDKVKSLDIEIKDWAITANHNKKYRDKLRSIVNQKPIPAQKSDIFTWDVLSTDGGFYSDMDIIFIKPMESFYKKICNYDNLVSFFDGYVSIGFLASGPQSKLYDYLLKNVSKQFNVKEPECVGGPLFSKLFNHSLESLCSKFPVTYNIPKHIVYPFTYLEYSDIYSPLVVDFDVDVVGVHWFGGGPASIEYSEYFTEDNFMDILCVFTYLALKVYKKAYEQFNI